MNKAKNKERELSCISVGELEGFELLSSQLLAHKSKKGSPHLCKPTNPQRASQGSSLCRCCARDHHGAPGLRAHVVSSEQGVLSPVPQHITQKTKSSLNSETSSGIWFVSQYNSGCLLQPKSPMQDVPLHSLFPLSLVNTLRLSWNVKDIVKPLHLPRLFWDKKLIL